MTLVPSKPVLAQGAIQELEADLPALENGDRLSREEFERRYHAMTEVKKAELVEGIVYMPSPVRFGKHGRPHTHVVTWIGNYEAATPGVFGADNSTARLDLDNEPQPDILLMIDPALGGQATISEDDYVEGAPELICEIAGSTASLDLHAKLHAYRRNGVREYIVWVTGQRQILWHVLEGSQYNHLASGDDGVVRSRVFPGLWLDPAALVQGDLAKVLQVLNSGIGSTAHADFVRQLNARRG